MCIRDRTQTIQRAKEAGIGIGAHPGLPDLMGFGRRSMVISNEEAKAYTLYQISALGGMCKAAGVKSVSYTHLVGGGALGFNTLLGIPTTVGYFIAGAIAILVFLMKNAMNAMDNLTKVLGAIMILVIFIVILIVQPPVGMAAKETVLPTASMSCLLYTSIKQ